MRLVKKGSDLIFISRINRDGSGTKIVRDDTPFQDDEFKLSRLSITEDTYIATNMSVFVVKLKNPE